MTEPAARTESADPRRAARPLHIAVVGAGTAGAAAAILLARAGHRVEVFERVADPGPVGAGITLQPTGQAALRTLGLLDEVAACGAPVDRLHGSAPKVRSSFYPWDALWLVREAVPRFHADRKIHQIVDGTHMVGVDRGVIRRPLPIAPLRGLLPAGPVPTAEPLRQ